MRTFVADEDAADMLTTAKQLEEDDHLGPLAVESERGYLGKEGSIKLCFLILLLPRRPLMLPIRH